MPWLSGGHPPIPTKDILSWYFDEPQVRDQDEPIYIDAADPSRAWSFRSARNAIRQIGAGLKALGVKHGDVVGIHSFNDVNYPILVNGILAAGGIFTGSNPAYTSYELSHGIKTAHVSFLVVEPELLPNAQKAAEENDIPRSRILIFDNTPEQTAAIPAGFHSWKVLFDHGETDWPRFDDLETAKNTAAGHLFSSGTTGLPKAAVISHYNFIAQHLMTEDWSPRPFHPVRLIPLPYFHVAVAPRAHFSPLKNGAKTVCMRRFAYPDYLAYVEKYKVTDLLCVPPIVIAIVMDPRSKEYDLSSVKYCLAGAAPLSADLQARFQALLPSKAPFTQVWGMTEATCAVTLFPYPEDDDTGSVGRPVPGIDVKLVDDDGKDITDYDTLGEMCIRGPSLIKGYLDNAEANKAWDADGYFHTGDVMYCKREDKKWYHVDRKKELIKVRGFQVAPPEIEGVLLDHPQIVDCAVIGIMAPDQSTELPRAYVVKRPGPEGDRLTEQDIHKLVEAKLSGYKQLTGGVVFLKEVPKNASGKILKRVLRENAKKETGPRL